jgi:hypothetical protein
MAEAIPKPTSCLYLFSTDGALLNIGRGTLTLYKYSSMEISAYGNYLITAFLSCDYYTVAKEMILYSNASLTRVIVLYL